MKLLDSEKFVIYKSDLTAKMENVYRAENTFCCTNTIKLEFNA